MLLRKSALPLLSLIFLFQAAGPGPEMSWVPPNNSKLAWLNVADWEAVGETFRPVRVPKQWRDQFPERTATVALAPAGVVLRFATNARMVALRVSAPPAPVQAAGGQQQQAPPPGGPRPAVPNSTAFDVYRNGQFLKSVDSPTGSATQEVVVYDDASGNNVELSVLFPAGRSFLVHGVGFSSGAQYGPPRTSARRRVLIQGDSITQGVGTTHARNAYAWVLCEQLGCEPINLGFAGSAWGDKPVADYVAQRNDWDVLVLAFGTNTYSQGRQSPSEFADTYNTFLETVRTRHPGSPILCITPLWRGADGTDEKNPAGYTHQQYREAIAQVVKRRQASDPNLHLLEGKDLVPQNLLNADQVHPTDEGAVVLASAVAKELKPLLKP